jgi:DNA-binding response OmpR family regulator
VNESILVIEDDPGMARVLHQGLEQEEYSVTLARTGWNGLELAQRGRFHAILLDVMLPGIDGYAIARQLRSEGNATPILMVTARDSVEDLVNGFAAGAEDYLRKPFSFLELLARLRSLIHRGRVQPFEMRVGDLVMEVSSHEVTRNGQRISLTKTEYRLLEIMMKHAGHVLSREALVTAVWGEGTSIERNSIDWQVKALRDKVDRNSPERLIHTVRGFGYKLSVTL